MRSHPDVVSLPWGDHHALEAFERAPAALVLIGPDGRWMRVNAALAQLVGRVSPGAHGAPELLHRALGAPIDGSVEGYELVVRRLAAADGERASLTYVRATRAGRRELRLELASCPSATGREVGSVVVGHLVEVEEPRALEADAMAELLGDEAVLLWVERGNIVRASEAARRVYGLDASGRGDVSLADVESARLVEDDPDDAPAGEERASGAFVIPDAYRARHRLVDGSFVDVDVRSRRLGPGRLLLSVREVRGAEPSVAMPTKLEQTHRLATVGALTAGVVHEINNPMTCVHANLELAAEVLTDVALAADPSDHGLGERLSDVRAAIDDAREGASQALNVARDLKQLVRAEHARFALVDPSAVIAAAAKLANVRVRERARVVLQLEPGARVFVDESRLAQVVLNLILNAAQAFPPGRSAPQNEIRLSCARDGDEVKIEVRDDGVGIDPALARQLFKPFVTDKPAGLGLGLSICLDLATRMGGRLGFESTLGVGTTFRLTLRDLGRPRAPATGPLDVLMIGDDAAARDAIFDRLAAGARLDVATDAAMARAALRVRRYAVVAFVDDGRRSAAVEDVCATLEDVGSLRAARVAILVRDRLGASTRALIERAGPLLVLAMPLGPREVEALLDAPCAPHASQARAARSPRGAS
jgi:signal transduction histidine kinase